MPVVVRLAVICDVGYIQGLGPPPSLPIQQLELTESEESLLKGFNWIAQVSY